MKGSKNAINFLMRNCERKTLNKFFSDTVGKCNIRIKLKNRGFLDWEEVQRIKEIGTN